MAKPKQKSKLAKYAKFFCMKSATPPPMFKPRAMPRTKKAISAFCSAALFAAVLFAASTAISHPASALITWSDPGTFTLAAGGTTEIDISDYASDTQGTISCQPASAFFNAAKFASVTSSGCVITVKAAADATSGFGSIAVTVNSTHENDSYNAFLDVSFGPASNIVFNEPTDIIVAKNFTKVIDAASYVEDGSYTFTCDEATGIDTTKLTTVSNSGDSCSFTIDPVDTYEGTASFTIPYTSSGGDTHDGKISITVGPDSDISSISSSGLTLRRATNNIMIDASHYASDGIYSISCTDGSAITSTVLIQSRSGCIFSIRSNSAIGSTSSISVDYSSSGGDTHTGTISFGASSATSDLSLTGTPPSYSVASGRGITINPSSYARVGTTGYQIYCGDATSIDNKITVERDSCDYTVTGGDTQGAAAFTVPYFDSGGGSVSRQLSVTVGPASEIEFSNPPVLSIYSNDVVWIDASRYATDGDYTVSCGNPESIDSKLSSVIRTPNTCFYEVRTGSDLGSAAFTVPYVSSGGHTFGGVIALTISNPPPPPSFISFREPDDLELGTNQTRVINALDYASDTGGYTLSCQDAASVDAKITVRRRDPRNSPCSFSVFPSGTQGTATFTVPYRSRGGTSRNGVFTIEIGAASTISFSGPPNLKLGTNRTRIIDARDYASDGNYYITCADASAVDSKITVARNDCSFTITPTGTQGSASFTVQYTSSGGHSRNGTIRIEIGTASTIHYSPSSSLTMTAGSSMTINAATYAMDGSYAITCGDATNRDAKIIRVTNTGCSYQVSTGSGTGTAAFTVPYTSEGGHALAGQISITVTALPENTAPALDRQDMICTMLGLKPVRHSTADRITEADNQALFCHKPEGVHCQRGSHSALVLRISGISLDQLIDTCYQAIN